MPWPEKNFAFLLNITYSIPFSWKGILGGSFISWTEAVWWTPTSYAAFHPAAGTDDGLNPGTIDLHKDCMNWRETELRREIMGFAGELRNSAKRLSV